MKSGFMLAIDVAQKERFHVKRLAALGDTATRTSQAASTA